MSVIHRRFKQGLIYATVALVLMTAWTLWAWLHREGGNALLSYYQTYETPAVAFLLSDPMLACQIVIGNWRMAIDSLPFVLGPAWTLTWPFLLAVSGAGIYRLARSGGGMIVAFVVCYLGTVLVHPFAPHRYLLPLVPLFVLSLIVGASWPWRADRNPGNRQRAMASAAAVLAILLAGNLLWLRYTPWRSEHVRGWYGMDMGYAWSGFQETFAWIRQNTDPRAKVAGIFDSMYFLYTGRQAVRPWFQHSESYFYPYGAAVPFVGRPADVARELRALNVDYLVFDPPAGYTEGPAAVSMLRSLLLLPEVRARRVFVSADGQHEVFQLWQSDVSSARSAFTARDAVWTMVDMKRSADDLQRGEP